MEEYYTPDPEEFRVGMEYETLRNGVWKLNEISLWKDKLEKEPARVKYLTKEQIESEGWEYHIQDQVFYKNKLRLQYNFTNKILTIDNGYSDETLFYGICKSINELKYIQKLLQIK